MHIDTTYTLTQGQEKKVKKVLMIMYYLFVDFYTLLQLSMNIPLRDKIYRETGALTSLICFWEAQLCFPHIAASLIGKAQLAAIRAET